MGPMWVVLKALYQHIFQQKVSSQASENLSGRNQPGWKKWARNLTLDMSNNEEIGRDMIVLLEDDHVGRANPLWIVTTCHNHKRNESHYVMELLGLCPYLDSLRIKGTDNNSITKHYYYFRNKGSDGYYAA